MSNPGPARSRSRYRRPSRRMKFSDRKRPSPVPPLRRLTKGSKTRLRSSDGIPHPLSATRRRTGLPAWALRLTRPPGSHACTALSTRLIRACWSSDSSARTCRPGRRGPISIRTPRSRAVGSTSPATSRSVTSRSTMSAELCPRDKRRKCCVTPRQRRICSRAILALSATPAHSGSSSCARASRSIPSRQASTVPSGVFSSWEKPEASWPSEASRCVSASRASAARRSVMSRQTSTTWSSSPCGPRIGDACTSSHATEPSSPRRSQMRTCLWPDSRHGSVGHSPAAVHTPGGSSLHEQPSIWSRTRPDRRRKASLAATTFPARIEDDDPVVDAVDDRLQAFSLAAHLAHQTRHGVGHRVELASQPGHGVRSLGGDPSIEIPLGDAAARSSRSAEVCGGRTCAPRSR